jgi:hypothetical protein
MNNNNIPKIFNKNVVKKKLKQECIIQIPRFLISFNKDLIMNFQEIK